MCQFDFCLLHHAQTPIEVFTRLVKVHVVYVTQEMIRKFDSLGDSTIVSDFIDRSLRSYFRNPDSIPMIARDLLGCCSEQDEHRIDGDCHFLTPFRMS
mmetsp:Transcript_11887/g.24226  ORF Transcript_11887/g.24226 Transcript_11887/m.24226 type:complete len:98 (-) Transcript_11887:522-815(-)